MTSLHNRRILLGITGGIAAYKTPELVRELVRRGAEVHVVMTESAQQFVTPLSLEVVSGHPVGTSLWVTQESGENREIHHTEAGRHADILVIAPATANFLGKAANGLANDLLDNIVLASTCPVLVCPSMNVNMYDNEVVAKNRETLNSLPRMTLLDPDSGELACGVEGKGRLPEPTRIADAIEDLLSKGDLAGKSIVITAGPTREPIDPVRFLSNPSTGKMGFALAERALARGAKVSLIHGPVHLSPPSDCVTQEVETAREMKDAVAHAIPTSDILIMAAAVADWTPAEPAAQKEEKQDESKALPMIRTPDILVETKDLGPHIRVGFAAQTHDLLEKAREKRIRKGLDLIVANPVSRAGAGFAADTNEGYLITDEGETPLPSMEKRTFADRILDAIVSLSEAKKR